MPSRNDRGTLYAGIPRVITIVIVMAALVDMRFIPCALQTMNPYLTWSLTIRGAAKGFNGWRETKLSADHVSVVNVPAVVTDCSPLAVSENFHPSSEWRVTNKADLVYNWITAKKKVRKSLKLKGVIVLAKSIGYSLTTPKDRYEYKFNYSPLLTFKRSLIRREQI